MLRCLMRFVGGAQLALAGLSVGGPFDAILPTCTDVEISALAPKLRLSLAGANAMLAGCE